MVYLGLVHALVVQWIGCFPPKEAMQVRFLPRAPIKHMSSEEFSGVLDDISPRLLVEDGQPLDDFFLVLSLIFNDLKGLLLWQNTLEDVYRPAPDSEKSAHAAEMAGMQMQLYRLLSGLIREFLAFLNENSEIVKSPAFQRILLRLSSDNRILWDDLSRVALGGEAQTKSTFAHSLMLIRHNIGFHYDQTRKEFRNSFNSFFKTAPRTIFNERAYFSLGKTMKGTRFYYADAAVKEYITQQAAKITIGSSEEKMTFDLHFAKLREMVGDMNNVIQALLLHHISLKKNPRG